MRSTLINVADLLNDHVVFQLESIDRLYLNGFVPKLQCGACLVQFLSQHRGHPIASPALLGHISGTFVAEVKAFAQHEGIPLFLLERREFQGRPRSRSARPTTGARRRRHHRHSSGKLTPVQPEGRKKKAQ